MKKEVSILLIIALILQLVGCSAISKVQDSASMVGTKAGKIAEDAVEEIGKAYEAASTAFSLLSFTDFKNGFETAASFFGTTVAALGGQTYVNSVADAINNLQQRISNRVSTNGELASQAGYAAEEWCAGTYNIDAIASGNKLRANTPQSNALGSPDVVAGDTNASLKYWKNAQSSAKQQAKSFFERYQEYKSETNNPKLIEDWLEDNDINPKTDADLYYSVYQEQLRIIPQDQLDDAIAYLERAIKSESSKESQSRHRVSESYQETLKKLTDRLKTADGTESIPLSKADAEALVKAVRDGDLDEEFLKLNLNPNSVVKGSYIAKQAIKSGATAAMIETAIVLGPEVYEIIKLGIESGELDEEQLMDAGINGLTAAGDGFLKGSISNALVIMCQAGKLGPSFTSASPELIGTLTVLVIDAVRYGIMLGNGNITTEQYLDTLAEEVFISAGALGSAALIGMLFPGASLAIMLGSFVGGLVVSAGYTTGKTFALAWIEESDIDLLVPVSEASNAIKDLKASLSLKLTDAIAGIKTIKDNAYKRVTIMVYDLTEGM